MAVLKTEDFTLEVKFNKFKEYKTFNSILTKMAVTVTVSSYDYSGKTQFACSKEEHIGFVRDLSEIYNSLKEGITGLSDYEPDQNNFYFESDGLGHFNVSGIFNNWGEWTLKFEKNIDQTYFKNFIKQLNDELN